MSFIRCGNHQHWGRYGAAGLLLTSLDRSQVLLQLRSRMVLSPGTWALPGGALERGESAQEAAIREAVEEVGLDRREITVTGTRPGLEHPRWRYTYVLATIAEQTLPAHTSWEASDHRWCDLDDVPQLHPDLARDWPGLIDVLR